MNYLKFQTNIGQSMVFNYNKGLEKDGKFGKQWLWGVNQGGVDAILSATERLNEMLEEIQPKGRLIEILKYEDGQKKLWKILENGQDITPQSNYAKKAPTTQNNTGNTSLPTTTPKASPDAVFEALEALRERIRMLNANQDKLVAKILELEKKNRGLYGACVAGKKEVETAYEFHCEMDLKQVDEEEVKLKNLPL
jgi:hypothetical protein